MTKDTQLDRIIYAFDRARELQSGQQYSETIPLLKSLIEDLKLSEYTDHYSEALLNLGVCYYETEQLNSAWACFIEGLKLEEARQNPNRGGLFLHELSLVADQGGRLDLALSLCRKSIDLRLDVSMKEIKGLFLSHMEYDINNFSQALFLLAILYQKNKQFNEAKEVLEILRTNCERTYHRELLGKVLNELGLVSFELDSFMIGIGCFLESIEVKSRLGNNRSIDATLANLQVCLQLHPSLMSQDDVLQLLKDAKLIE